MLKLCLVLKHPVCIRVTYVTQQNLHNLLAYSIIFFWVIYWAIIKYKYQKSSTLTKGKCPMHERVKAKHSTGMCILAFKEAILKHRDLSSNVYTCFLDASKAFDRINHFKLFTTLSKRNVPMYIIRILIFWYTSQTMYVRWNNTMSTGFNVSNGVRQGGILSPYIFCIFYMCTENVKIALFKSYCTTLYTSTLWCKYRRESLRKLCVAYNNIFS